MRVLAIGSAVGATFLGNTYQSANLVSNILFELLAAGVLSSVLIPAFVKHIASDNRNEATELANVILGMLLAVLGPIVMMGIFGGSWIMSLITVTVENPVVREQQIALGTFFLWFFLPQILLYAVGAISTGLLNSDHRFGAPAAAPALNNLIVVTTMAMFWMMRAETPTLTLPLSQKLVLAIGTTLGVVGMTMVPTVAAWRAGFRLRPKWQPRHEELRAMAKKGTWAAGYLGLTQVLLAVTLILANRMEGGAVAYQIAFTFFLLPYALVGNPILTILFPRLSSDAHANDKAAFGQHLGKGLRQLSFFVLPASALLIALAEPMLEMLSFGALSANVDLVARTLIGYSIGLLGYAAFQLLTRASYAEEDTRTPTLINLFMAATGTILMLWWSSSANGIDRVASLGLAHSVVQIAGSLILLLIITKRLPNGLRVTASLARAFSASLLAGMSAWLLAESLTLEGRLGTAITVTVAGFAGIAIYAVVQFVLGSPELRTRHGRQEATA